MLSGALRETDKREREDRKRQDGKEKQRERERERERESKLHDINFNPHTFLRDSFLIQKKMSLVNSAILYIVQPFTGQIFKTKRY